VAGSIVYIQPVYLQAAARLKIPQLKRLIVCQGEMVIMEPSLEEGFAKMNERLKAKGERIRERLQRLAPPPAEAPPGAAPPPVAAPTPAPATSPPGAAPATAEKAPGELKKINR
jgi:uncharacterized membrane protein (UPF0182 family)